MRLSKKLKHLIEFSIYLFYSDYFKYKLSVQTVTVIKNTVYSKISGYNNYNSNIRKLAYIAALCVVGLGT